MTPTKKDKKHVAKQLLEEDKALIPKEEPKEPTLEHGFIQLELLPNGLLSKPNVTLASP